MSRKRLAEVSTVSERYLAQLESGQGNMSIALLRKVTSAIGISMGALMSEEVTESCVSKTSMAAQNSGKPAAVSSEPCAKTGAVHGSADAASMNSQQGRDSLQAPHSMLGSSSVETV